MVLPEFVVHFWSSDSLWMLSGGCLILFASVMNLSGMELSVRVLYSTLSILIRPSAFISTL